MEELDSGGLDVILTSGLGAQFFPDAQIEGIFRVPVGHFRDIFFAEIFASSISIETQLTRF